MWRKYIISRFIGNVLIIATICFFIGALIYNFASSGLIKNEEESLVNVTLQGVRTIEKDIESHFYILEAIARREDIKNLNYPWENKLEILKKEVKDYAFKRISIADINGYTKTSDDKEFYIGDRDYFKRAVKGENVISEPIISRADGTLVIIFAVRIFYNEELPGVLYATYDIDHLYKMTQDIKIGNRGSSFIINSEGKAIAGVNRGLIYGMNTNQGELTDNSELRQLDQLINYVIENNMGTKQYSYGGIKKIAGFAPIPQTKWYLIVTAPINLVFKNIRKVLSFMTAVAIIIVLVLSISYTYVRYMRYKARKQEKISKLTIEAANIIIINFNHNWEVTYFNKYAEVKSGYKKENVIGIKTIFDIVSKDDLDKVEEFVNRVEKRQPFFNYELPLIDADGNLFFVIWNTNISSDIFDNIISAELIGMDITDRIESEKQLIRNHEELTQLYEELSASEIKLKQQYDELLYNKQQLEKREEYIKKLAYHDFLTKLPNRIYFEEKLRHDINKGNSCISILFIDIDNFKYINDYFGHSFGDNLLIKLAKRIETVGQYGNFTARFGGDEFIVLAHVSGREEAKNCAEELLRAISMSFSIKGVSFSITASIGISIYPEDSTNFDELLRNADTAMYKAKEQGKNGYVFFDSEMNKALYNQMVMGSNLIDSVDNNELVVYYQPLYNIQEGKIEGFEALVRWNSPKYGFVQPNVFIPLAEEMGIIVPIDRYVLEKACSFLKSLHCKGFKDLKISVNISVIHLFRDDFVDFILDIIQSTGLKHEHVILEITETLLMENYGYNIIKIEKLRKSGLNIAIDDFGKGYSSLSYLKKLPVNILKIDKTFISDINNVIVDDISTTSNEIVGSVITLAHTLGLMLIAEGVETIEQLEYLSIHGCDMAQGYSISKPVPESEVLGLLRKYTK